MSGTSTAAVAGLEIESTGVTIEDDETGVAPPAEPAADPTHNSVVLSWRNPIRPRNSLVQYRLRAGGGTFGQWKSILASYPGGRHAGGYEVPNLSSSVEYAFELRYMVPGSPAAFSPAVGASAATFEPFTGRFTSLPGFFDSDASPVPTALGQFVNVKGELNDAFYDYVGAMTPGNGLVDKGQSTRPTLLHSDKPGEFGWNLAPLPRVTAFTITLKAPAGPKVRCTPEEASHRPGSPITKICSRDLRPLVEDVVGIVRAERRVTLHLDPRLHHREGRGRAADRPDERTPASGCPPHSPRSQRGALPRRRSGLR